MIGPISSSPTFSKTASATAPVSAEGGSPADNRGASADGYSHSSKEAVVAPASAAGVQEGVLPPAKDHGEAVVVSLEAEYTLKKLPPSQSSNAPGLQIPESTKKMLQLISLQFQRGRVAIAEHSRAMIAYIEAHEPIPERVLTGDEAEAVRARFKDADPVMTSTDGAKSYLEDQMLYRISAQGEVTVRHQLIPTSEENKQNFLTDLRRSLEEAIAITGGRSVEDFDREIARLEQSASKSSQSTAQSDPRQSGQHLDSTV